MAQQRPGSYEDASRLVDNLRKQKSTDQAEWRRAKGLLEQAIRENPDPFFISDGIRVRSYFPYYYLGLVQFQLGETVEAEANLRKALSLDKLERDEKQVVQTVLAELREMNAWRPKVARARELIAAGEIEGAQTFLDEIPQASLSEAEVVAVRRDIDQRKTRFAGLRSQAETHLQRAEVNSGLRVCDEARPVHPQLYERQLAQTRQRLAQLQSDSQRDLKEGRAAQASGSYSAARSKFEAALASNSENREARSALSGLQTFEQGLREGLRMLFQGRTSEAARRLQSLEENADSLAFLGVAYAIQSLESEGSVGNRAVEQFRKVRQQWPAYRLPSSLVSPQIQQLFQQSG